MNSEFVTWSRSVEIRRYRYIVACTCLEDLRMLQSVKESRWSAIISKPVSAADISCERSRRCPCPRRLQRQRDMQRLPLANQRVGTKLEIQLIGVGCSPTAVHHWPLVDGHLARKREASYTGKDGSISLSKRNFYILIYIFIYQLFLFFYSAWCAYSSSHSILRSLLYVVLSLCYRFLTFQ